MRRYHTYFTSEMVSPLGAPQAHSQRPIGAAETTGIQPMLQASEWVDAGDSEAFTP